MKLGQLTSNARSRSGLVVSLVIVNNLEVVNDQSVWMRIVYVCPIKYILIVSLCRSLQLSRKCYTCEGIEMMGIITELFF